MEVALPPVFPKGELCHLGPSFLTCQQHVLFSFQWSVCNGWKQRTCCSCSCCHCWKKQILADKLHPTHPRALSMRSWKCDTAQLYVQWEVMWANYRYEMSVIDSKEKSWCFLDYSIVDYRWLSPHSLESDFSFSPTFTNSGLYLCSADLGLPLSLVPVLSLE